MWIVQCLRVLEHLDRARTPRADLGYIPTALRHCLSVSKKVANNQLHKLHVWLFFSSAAATSHPIHSMLTSKGSSLRQNFVLTYAELHSILSERSGVRHYRTILSKKCQAVHINVATTVVPPPS